MISPAASLEFSLLTPDARYSQLNETSAQQKQTSAAVLFGHCWGRKENWYCLKMCQSSCYAESVRGKSGNPGCSFFLINGVISLLIATVVGSAFTGFILYVAVGSQLHDLKLIFLPGSLKEKCISRGGKDTQESGLDYDLFQSCNP